MIGCGDAMDISSLNTSSIKIRLRHASFVVDPAEDLGSKVSCDAIVFLDSKNSDLFRVADYRIVINGPGEYEINGVKITGMRVDNGLVYNIIGDGARIVLGKTKEISKTKEEINTDCQIAILNVDREFTPSIVTGFEPKAVVLYGNERQAGAKILGKENLTPIKKFTITKDKLPEEMEVVILG